MTKLEQIKNKILSLDEAKKRLAIFRLKGQKIVFTNGCFDIIHKGHIATLTGAAELGNKLIIGLNSDESVKILKGNNRPIYHQDDRALVLGAFTFVDMVIVFNEETPYELIKNIEPDVLVKGGDYSIEKIAGADIVINNGGEVVTIPFETGFSSSETIEKISQL